MTLSSPPPRSADAATSAAISPRQTYTPLTSEQAAAILTLNPTSFAARRDKNLIVFDAHGLRCQ